MLWPQIHCGVQGPLLLVPPDFTLHVNLGSLLSTGVSPTPQDCTLGPPPIPSALCSDNSHHCGLLKSLDLCVLSAKIILYSWNLISYFGPLTQPSQTFPVAQAQGVAQTRPSPSHLCIFFALIPDAWRWAGGQSPEHSLSCQQGANLGYPDRSDWRVLCPQNLLLWS